MRAPLRRLSRRPRDDGAAAVEFALVSPLLFALLFGILEYGYGFFELQAAQATVHMAAESASAGVAVGKCATATAPTSSAPLDPQALPDIVRQAASGNGFKPGGDRVRVTFTVTSAAGGTFPVTGDPAVLKMSYTPRLRLFFVPYPDRIDVQAAAGAQSNGTQSVMKCATQSVRL